MRASIIPTLPYRDAAAAIDWLCRAFGFTRHAVYPDGAGGVGHAQLVLDNSMIMLGTAREEGSGALQYPPAGHVTQSPYIIVRDVDAHHARAVLAGAEIVAPLKDEEYGGRGYSCRDPEGHLWHFGTYDPWKAGR